MSQFLVVFHEGPQFVTTGVFEATDGADANGQAALKTGRDGKFTAFAIADATTTMTERVTKAESTTVPFFTDSGTE